MGGALAMTTEVIMKFMWPSDSTIFPILTVVADVPIVWVGYEFGDDNDSSCTAVSYYTITTFTAASCVARFSA